MSSSIGQDVEDEIAGILERIREKGIRLWSENGELRYRAPKGALTREEIKRLKAFKGQIVASLEGRNECGAVESERASRGQVVHAPLTFSQLAHWNFRRLSERPSIRQLASATRLRGRLNTELLMQSLAKTVNRHEALRTQIVILDRTPVQSIAETGHSRLLVEDLTALSESQREAEVRHLIDELVMEPTRVAVDPLFRLRLVKLGDEEHVLIVAMEHMISDAFSMNILLRDLFAFYVQALTGHAWALPPIHFQFADYAAWQKSANKAWAEKHGGYWAERLAGCQRLRFPDDRNLSTADQFGWGAAPVCIEGGLKAELRDWCRLRRTTLVMSMLTVFIGLVSRWCDASDVVIRYQTDGRSTPKVENTIGFFASVLHLRVQLLHGDTFVDLLSRVTQEYCNAYEHNDHSLIDAKTPRPGFAENAAFNWVPHEPKSGFDGSGDLAHTLAWSTFPFSNPVLKTYEKDGEPTILFYDTDEEITGSVLFPMNSFTAATMARFAQNFLMLVEKLLRAPRVPVADIALL